MEFVNQIIRNQLVLVIDDDESEPPESAGPKCMGGVNATMTAATKVVQEVLQQLSWKDLP